MEEMEDNSYANNSSQQKEVILKAKPLLQETMTEFYCNNFPDCIRFTDMGCSTGPNALLPTWEILDALHKTCHSLNRKPPVLHVFLNDLPGNDFNTIFKSLPGFYERLKKGENQNEFLSCFIAAVAGSFYGRLFPPRFLHFVFSSYSLHWLSKGVVEESKLDTFNIPMYAPSLEEVRHVIQREESYYINLLETFELSWDAGSNNGENSLEGKYTRGKQVAMKFRPVVEPILVSHFGNDILDGLFQRLSIRVADCMEKGLGVHTNVIISLTKK
ncbi:hypothetical protein Patl1_01824 [Pistacia atlantica]|uniref:Uncharacterized protein n=1 Tax=Pistacia atlantica TaxID=434234 RepID=A0ACC1C9A9_9ROSI|nr:hypothetical protein Patl1_01824 [Pistacia atlantica]